jgi:hypothetical protein
MQKSAARKFHGGPSDLIAGHSIKVVGWQRDSFTLWLVGQDL